MIEKIDGIILEMVKHNDRNNVAVVYTRTRGRMAFLVPLGKSMKSRSKLSSLLLLARVSGDVRIRPGKDIHNLSNITSAHSWRSLYFNPVKSTLVFFLSEFLGRFLRQAPPDENLWNYIIYSLETLDNLPAEKIANFHIAFLTGLLHISGIMPMLENYQPGMIFDMQTGEYRFPELQFGIISANRNQKLHGQMVLNEQESQFLTKLARINYRNMTKFRFNRVQRSEVLDRLLQFFSLHLPIGSNLKSLDVLKEIFS